MKPISIEDCLTPGDGPITMGNNLKLLLKNKTLGNPSQPCLVRSLFGSRPASTVLQMGPPWSTTVLLFRKEPAQEDTILFLALQVYGHLHCSKYNTGTLCAAYLTSRDASLFEPSRYSWNIINLESLREVSGSAAIKYLLRIGKELLQFALIAALLNKQYSVLCKRRREKSEHSCGLRLDQFTASTPWPLTRLSSAPRNPTPWHGYHFYWSKKKKMVPSSSLQSGSTSWNTIISHRCSSTIKCPPRHTETQRDLTWIMWSFIIRPLHFEIYKVLYHQFLFCERDRINLVHL